MTDTTNAANSSPITAECAANSLTTATDVAAFIERKADDYAREYGVDDMGSLSFGNDAMRDYHWGLLELADEIGKLAAPQPQGGALTDERIHALIAGALFDFMGHLTGREERITLSARDLATPAVEALGEWAEKRGLNLNVADVPHWHKALTVDASAPSAPQQAGDGLTARIREAIARGLGASRIDEHYDTDPIVDDIARRIGGVIDAPVASRAEFMTTSELEEIARENAIHAALDRLLHSDDLMDGISAVRGMLANPPAASRKPGEMGAGVRPTDDELWDQTLSERDRYHEIADDLAAQIAAITDVEIGEHSSANDPWRNAMLAADDFIAAQLRKLLTGPAASAQQDERQCTCGGGALSGSHSRACPAFDESMMRYDPFGLAAQQDEHCQCPACVTGTIHASDCAVHNTPAYPNGQCDCGVAAQQDEREALIRALEAAIREAESYEHRAVSVANIRAAISLISTELPAMASDEMIDAACAAVTPPLYRVDAMRAVEAALRAAQQVQADAGAVAYIPDDALARLTPPLLVLDGVRLYRYNAVGTTALYTRPAAESVKRDDAALLDWLMHNIGGNALRAIGVITSAGCDRSAIRAAMSREQSGGERG